MAIFNEILVGRYNRALQKLLGIKGSPPVRQVGGEIMPILGMFYGVDNRFLETWYRYAFNFDQPAIAGLTTAVRFRNPAGSGVIAVLESVKIWSAGAQNIQMRQRDVIGDVNLGTAFQIQGIERRQFGVSTQRSNTNISQDLAGNQQGTIVNMFPMPAGGQPLEQILFDEQEFVVDPGQWFQWFGDLANTRWVINFIWRERPLEESERQ